MMWPKRVMLIVLDGLGIGAVAGANPTHLVGAHSLSNALGDSHRPGRFPFLERAGLFAAAGMDPRRTEFAGAWGRTRQTSEWPESYSGHWEMAGFRPSSAHGHPEGLDEGMLGCLQEAFGDTVIGNLGTYPHIERVPAGLIAEHQRTGRPILLVQPDVEPISVLALYVCPEVVDTATFFAKVGAAVQAMNGAPVPGRLGGRLFDIVDGAAKAERERVDHPYFRLPADTVVCGMERAGLTTFATGKVNALFNGAGFVKGWPEWGSETIMRNSMEAWTQLDQGLLWINFNDLSRPCGAYRDVPGWRNALALYDGYLQDLYDRLDDDDIMIITGDHGVDPTLTGEHTYEWTPLLVLGPQVIPTGLGERRHEDISATLTDLLNLDFVSGGSSFGRGLLKEER